MVRKGKTWLLGAAFIVCCSNAADSVVEDAGDILRDAGEVLSDAGEALRDAGTSDAAAQPMPTVEVACDPYERTLPGSKLTRWYARTKISPGADVDAWLCEHQEFGEVPSCSQTEGCEGDEWPAHLSCVQAAIEMDEVGNVLVLCGLRQETVGNVSGSTWRTLRLKVR